MFAQLLLPVFAAPVLSLHCIQTFDDVENGKTGNVKWNKINCFQLLLENRYF